MLVSTHYMDEAERCHEIAYIAYGQLLAQGTIDEVIAQSHLRTYTVSGPDLQSLAEKLAGIAGVDMVAPFGTSLHVAGRDAEALDRGHRAVPRRSRAALGAVAAVAGGRVHRPDGRARRTTSNDRPCGIAALGRHLAHGGHVHQGVRAAAARPADLRHHDLHPRRAAPAVRLRHQHHAAPSADRRPHARGQRPRPLDPGRAQQHLLLRGHAARPHGSRDGPLDALGRRAVRRRDPRGLRARRAARRPAGAAGGGRRQRSRRRRHGARRARGRGEDGAGARPRPARDRPRRLPPSRSASTGATIRPP